MIYSVGCEYAIRALVKLATLGPPGTFVLLRELHDGEKMPPHFLGKLFQSLVREGILLSAKGRRGGFCLKRPLAQTKLRGVVQAIDGHSRLRRCFYGFETCGDGGPACPPGSACAAMRKRVEEMLDGTTLADLVLIHEQRGRRRRRAGGARA